MASGPGWPSKLWIGVNGEALIGIELLSSQPDSKVHLTTHCKYTCKYKLSHALKGHAI